MEDGDSSVNTKIRSKKERKEEDEFRLDGQDQPSERQKSAKSKNSSKTKKDDPNEDGGESKSKKSKNKTSKKGSENESKRPEKIPETSRTIEAGAGESDLNLMTGHNESLKVPQMSMKSVKSLSKRHSNTVSVFKNTLQNEKSMSELEGINEIRKRREEDRVKDMHFFRNQKQAQIAKNMEIRRQELLKEQEKENKRKNRHEMLRKQVVDFKQCQTERRRSIDKQYSEFIGEKTQKRHKELQSFLKTRHEEYLSTFKKDYDDFKRREKEKLKKQQIKERGWAKAKDKEATNDKLIENWDDIKKARAIEAKVHSLFNSSTIQDIINSYKTELQDLFEYYSAINLDPFAPRLSGWGGGGALAYRNFFAFVIQVGLMPNIIEMLEFKALYRTVTKGLLINKTIPIGLTFDQFKEMLFRVVLKRKDYFAKINPPDESKKKFINIEYVNIFGPEFHSYEDIKDVQDEYNDIDNFHYVHLDGLFHFLALPSDHEKLVAYLESLRKAFHKAKPASHKKRTKKIEYERMHTTNEKSRSQMEKLYGPSDYRRRHEMIKMAKDKIEQDRREWGLKNKRLMSSRRRNSQDSNAEMTDPVKF